MKPLKVWGGRPFVRGFGRQQPRTIVAAASAKRAREMLEACTVGRISAGEWKNYWSETGNALELSVAFEEGVWVSTLDFPRRAEDYVRLGPKP